MSLTLKKNTISNFFYCIHIVEIPTNKGANSYKLNISKRGNLKVNVLNSQNFIVSTSNFWASIIVRIVGSPQSRIMGLSVLLSVPEGVLGLGTYDRVHVFSSQ